MQQESLLTIKLDQRMSLSKDESNNNNVKDDKFSINKKFNSNKINPSPLKKDEMPDEVIDETNLEINEDE